MKIKTVTIEGKTYAVVDDNGHPIYVHDDGKELPFDAAAVSATVTRVTAESKGFKERAQAAEGKLTAFGDMDPTAASKALETIANIDAKKLIDAGKVDEIKAAAIAATEDKYKGLKIENDALKGERDGIRGKMDNLIRSNAFKGSKYIADKVAVPPHMLEKTFGDRFKVEDDKLVALGGDGKPLFSRIKPGEPAEFDEAIELTIAADPYKDTILKGAVGGGGARPGGGTGGGKTIGRDEWKGLAPDVQMAKAREGVTVVD